MGGHCLARTSMISEDVYLILFYVCECLPELCICTTGMQYLQRLEEGVKSPGAGVTGGCEHQVLCKGDNDCTC